MSSRTLSSARRNFWRSGSCMGHTSEQEGRCLLEPLTGRRDVNVESLVRAARGARVALPDRAGQHVLDDHERDDLERSPCALVPGLAALGLPCEDRLVLPRAPDGPHGAVGADAHAVAVV